MLWGREGDDSYFVDRTTIVVEYAGQGYDVVYARASYALSAGMSRSRCWPRSTILATTALNLTGNELDNYIVGNAGANTLDGGGGADVLWGREGDDSYFVGFGRHRHRICGSGLRHRLRPLQLRAGGRARGRDARHGRQFGDHGDQPDRQRASPTTSCGNAGANILDGGGGSDILHRRAAGPTPSPSPPRSGGGNVDTDRRLQRRPTTRSCSAARPASRSPRSPPARCAPALS